MDVLVVRRRGYRLVGITAALALLLGGAAFVQLRAADSWSSMERTVRELRASYDARSFRRESLWGNATDDNAFVHYERADAAARQLQAAHLDALRKMLPHDDARLAAAPQDLRAAWQPVLTHLRAGAHATDVRRTAGPDADPEQQMANLLDARWVANAAIFEARALRHEGRAVEAVQWSLDAATYAADLMRGSNLINCMIGAAMLAITTNEAWRDDATLSTLNPQALDLLAVGLERLDASLPETVDLTHEVLLCAHMLQTSAFDEEWMPSAWRYGFSTRWMVGDAVVEYAELAAELGDARTAAWPQRSALWAAATDEALACGNPVMQAVLPNVSSAEFNLREVIARLRMLRMAVDLHREMDAPPLRDPLGTGPLVVAKQGGGVRITSAGTAERRPVDRFVAR